MAERTTSEFFKDYDSRINELMSNFAVSRDVGSIDSMEALEKLGFNTFKGVSHSDEQQEMLLEDLRVNGPVSALLAIRNGVPDFRKGAQDSTKNALAEAGIKAGLFGASKYLGLGDIYKSMSEFDKKIEAGKLTPTQFFKVMTSYAHVRDVYSKSEKGLEYLAFVNAEAMPYIGGRARLNAGKEGKLNSSYAKAIEASGIDIEKFQSIVAGKLLPEHIVKENWPKATKDFNLKNQDIERLSTAGMQAYSLAGEQAYSALMSQYVRTKLGTLKEDETPFQYNGLQGEDQAAIINLLSINGEETIDEVNAGLESKIDLMRKVATEIAQSGNFDAERNDQIRFTYFSESFKHEIRTVPRGQREEYATNAILDLMAQQAVATGAFAAEKDSEFFYRLSQGCANLESNKVVATTEESALYHDGNVLEYSKRINTNFSEQKFEEVKKELTDKYGELITDLDLTEAKPANFAANRYNILAKSLGLVSVACKFKEETEDQEKITNNDAEGRNPTDGSKKITQQTRPCLYKSLPLYKQYMQEYAANMSKFGIIPKTAADIIKEQNQEARRQEQLEEQRRQAEEQRRQVEEQRRQAEEARRQEEQRRQAEEAARKIQERKDNIKNNPNGDEIKEYLAKQFGLDKDAIDSKFMMAVAKHITSASGVKVEDSMKEISEKMADIKEGLEGQNIPEDKLSEMAIQEFLKINPTQSKENAQFSEGAQNFINAYATEERENAQVVRGTSDQVEAQKDEIFEQAQETAEEYLATEVLESLTNVEYMDKLPEDGIAAVEDKLEIKIMQPQQPAQGDEGMGGQ